MADVFISFDSPEDLHEAREIARGLERDGWSVWGMWKPYVGWWPRIVQHELRAAPCVVVLWSRTSVQSDMVLAEAMEGLERRGLVSVDLEDDLDVPIWANLQNRVSYRKEGGPALLSEHVRLVLTGQAAVEEEALPGFRQSDLRALLDAHQDWLARRREGRRLALSGLDLAKLDLANASLRAAYLSGCDLTGVAGLKKTALRRAYLKGTRLPEHVREWHGIGEGLTSGLSDGSLTWVLGGFAGSLIAVVTLLVQPDAALLLPELVTIDLLGYISVPPVAAFYLVAVVLCAGHLYLLAKLSDLISECAAYPDVFEDGSDLLTRAHPLIRPFFELPCWDAAKLDGKRSRRLSHLAKSFMALYLLPLALLALWIRSWPSHNLPLVVCLGLLFGAALTGSAWIHAGILDDLGPRRGPGRALAKGAVGVVCLVLLGLAVVSVRYPPRRNLPAGLLRPQDKTATIDTIEGHCKSLSSNLPAPVRTLLAVGPRAWSKVDRLSMQTSRHPLACTDYLKRNRRHNFRFALIGGEEASLPSQDLSGFDFTCSVFLGNSDFSGSRFCESDLSFSIVRGRFDHADLAGTDLNNSDLDASFVDATLDEASLLDARVRGDFSGATLVDTQLVRADLQSANFRSANLAGASLRDAMVLGANLECANLDGTDLAGVDLDRVPKLRCAKIGGIEALTCEQKRQLFRREARIIIDWELQEECRKKEDEFRQVVLAGGADLPPPRYFPAASTIERIENLSLNRECRRTCSALRDSPANITASP